MMSSVSTPWGAIAAVRAVIAVMAFAMSSRLVLVIAVMAFAMSSRLVLVIAVMAAWRPRVATARRVAIPLRVAVPVVSHLPIVAIRRMPHGGPNRTIMSAHMVVIPA
jgi:hypothetical protein